jgi:hypothetical protein
MAAADAGGNAVYGDLRPGDRFHFPKRATPVYEKLKGGWYRVAFDGILRPAMAFRTGSGTAVVKLDEGAIRT